MTGYYGKLPLRGDFIHRNLDDGFVKMWDNWLQIVINNSREILGDQWLDAYLVSPIWRFYLPLRDSKAYCGIMLPSVDKVGRYFPLAIAKTVVDSIYSPDFIRHQQSWFDNAERLALLAL
ncbi:MAG TPA: type VI secretion system-associated protein TagF, partial [Gammaproteobacteria bacterium]|nr:type VI secretion system-associated protein TagF [Gammaproteobacteria bacterium]